MAAENSPLARLRALASQLLPFGAASARITRESIAPYAVKPTTALRRATIGDQLRRHAKNTPDKLAIVFYHGEPRQRVTKTYAQLNEEANRLAASFRALGLQRGDVVGIMSRNSPDFLVLYFACLKSGIVITTINITYTEKEIAYQLGHAKPSLLVVEPLFVPRVVSTLKQGAFASVRHLVVSDLTIPAAAGSDWKSLAELVRSGSPDDGTWEALDILEDDVAMMQYTSGTESFPKGVLLSHRNFLASTTPAWNSALEVMPTDAWLFVLPMFTMAGIGTATTLTLLGATIVLPQTIDAGSAIDMIVNENVSIMAQTPTFYLAMAAHPTFDRLIGTRLRKNMTYGGTVPPAMVEAWAGKGAPDLVWGTYWGQSELTQLGCVGWFKTLEDIPGGDPSWIGKPVPQLETKIVDEAGKEVPIGEEGELICRSPSVMLGYFGEPAKTAEVVKSGWLWTGDVVRRDAEGNLFFCDRRKFLIKTGGHNVSTVEVERVVYQNPAVLECSVVGLPDPKWSEAVAAFVVLKPEAISRKEGFEAELINFIKDKAELSAYKVPKRVIVVDALPKDTQGKILKRELRRIYGAA